MYKNHQPKIATFAQASPENLRRVVNFVILTIQNPLARVADYMAAVDREGERCKYLYGSKRGAFIYARDNAEQLYNEAMAINTLGNARDAEKHLLELFARIPGIGIVKSGFIVQLAFGLGGCIDTHNLTRFGIKPTAVKSFGYKNAKTWKTKYKRLAQYQDICAKLGGTEFLWDSWCEFVAARTGRYSGGWSSAFEVSRAHAIAIGAEKITLAETVARFNLKAA